MTTRKSKPTSKKKQALAKKSTTKKAASASRTLASVYAERDKKLKPYREKSDELLSIRFYDDEEMPDFLVDVVASFLNELENRTEVLWNTRDVLRVAVPLMLQRECPNPDDLDALFSRNSPLVLSALHDSLDCNDSEGRYPFTALGILNREDRKLSKEEKLQAELEGDADALSRIIHSKHTPKNFRSTLLEALDEIRVAGDDPKVLRVDYPLSVLRLKERSASGEKE
jgi:hypothetical protein